MTDCFYLEFDPDKLAILKQEAFELDLSLEEYLSEMLEDMVSFNREKTEDELNMDRYKTIKWKDREVESSAIERFSEEWYSYIADKIEQYFFEDDDEDESILTTKSYQGCLEYLFGDCLEYIEEEMEFPCIDLVGKTADCILQENNRYKDILRRLES